MKTSISHPLQIGTLELPSRGRIGLTFCPGKVQPTAATGSWNRDLDLDLDAIRAWGADLVLSLVEPKEFEQLQVPARRLSEGLARRGIGWFHLPIPDLGTPGQEFEARWSAAVGPALRHRLRHGGAVVLHCKGGLGRTGTVAARLMVELGEADPKEAIRRTRAARPGAIENLAQERHVEACSSVDESPSPETEDRLDRLRGCLLAGAVGDALGAAIEFLSLAEIRRLHGSEGVTDLVPADGRLGAITDDTQMLLFTAEGLIRASVRGRQRGIVDPPTVVWHAYQRWLHTQGTPWPECAAAGHGSAEPDGWLIRQPALFSRRAPGNTCLSSLRARTSPHDLDSVINDSKGCGGVMRVAPVAFVAALTPDVFELAAATARITHTHPSGYLASGALAVIVERLVAGEDLDRAIETARRRLRREARHGETLAAIDAALALGVDPSAEALESLGAGWVAEEALAMSLYCARAFAGEPDPEQRLRRSLLLAVNHSGDSDSTGAITGNLLGTLLGAAAIPAAWLEPLELRQVIEALAADLVLETSGTPDETEAWLQRYPGC